MRVAQYLEKFGLPKGYPLVAREPSLRRTKIALELGLGRKKPPEVVQPTAAAKEAAGEGCSENA